MEDTKARKKFSLRGFTSLLLMGLFVVLGLSGAMLYASPRGRVANWSDWTLFGLGKGQWEGIHLNVSLLFLIVAGLHLVLNWRPFWGYVKKRAGLGLNRKAELALAAAITVGVVLGTLYEAPPFSTVVAWRDGFKDYWEHRTVRAPVPHAEEFTLAEFAGHIRLSADETAEALRQEGYDVADHTVTLAELADSKAVPPSQVLADVRKHYPQAGGLAGPGGGGGAGRGMGQGMGLGRGMGRGGGQGFGLGANAGAGCGADAGGGSGCDESADACPTSTDSGNCPHDAAAPGSGRGMGFGQGQGGGRGFGQGGGRGMGRGYGRGTGQHGEASDESAD